MSADVITKDDFLSKILSLCTTFTNEAMAIASARAKELGFDPNRGLIPLPESFINLSSARSTIEDAVEKQKLIQLPITVQREILANLEIISKSLQGMMAGVDEVVNLTNAIEALNTTIWKYGLHNLSDQVLGYQKKLNQLKNQEVQISKIMAILQEASVAAEKTKVAATETEQQKNSATGFLDQVKQTATSSATALEQVKETNTKATASLAIVQQNEKQSGELTASIKVANNELTALDASIRKFYGEVDDYRKKITATSEDASALITTSETALSTLTADTNAKVDEAIHSLELSTKKTIDDLTGQLDTKKSKDEVSFSKLESTAKTEVATFTTGSEAKLTEAIKALGISSSSLISESQEKLTELEQNLATRSESTIQANEKKTTELVTELAKLKDQIREQIQQATGFQLFGAFQSRQNEISKSKNIWVWAIGLLVLISAGVTVWIAHEAQFYSVNNFAFWVKLSLTVPLGFAITFCTVQYGRERRLEEEYAFKSSISVSLNPYRDLVHSILKDGQMDQGKYSDFVINTVTNVFTPPTDKVFEGDKKSGFTEKTFKQTAEIIGTAVKAAK